MNSIDNTVLNRSFETEIFDENGFILDEKIWTKDLADEIASREGLQRLNEKHWLVLDTLRSKYQNFGGMPSMRSVCRTSGVPKYDILFLFGSCLTVWKIAGLCDPGDEARNYMQ